jgi:hypothetical protein
MYKSKNGNREGIRTREKREGIRTREKREGIQTTREKNHMHTDIMGIIDGELEFPHLNIIALPL